MNISTTGYQAIIEKITINHILVWLIFLQKVLNYIKHKQGGTLSRTDGRALDFPPIEDVSRQDWVSKLGSRERTQYEEDRARAIQVDIPIVADRMRNLPGFEQVPEEAILNMSHRVALMIHDAYDEGRRVAQIVIDNVKYQESVDRQLVSYHIARLGGYG